MDIKTLECVIQMITDDLASPAFQEEDRELDSREYNSGYKSALMELREELEDILKEERR